ncbi:MAG TPA: RluA family pseudouridine synthase, partial [Thermoanaerobaculia bacterium]|nr:RluA family pseudouridine synthase [Thermoanaerobaculia bacterium]
MRRIVGPEQEGLRLDQFLAAVAPVSRRRARELVAAGKVRRNGAQVRVQRRPVRRGDVVELAEDALPGEAAPPQPPPAILFRDAWLVAVDKPAGVLSQPAERRAPGELAMDERLMLALAGDEPGKPFLRLVHRLDRVTSGVLLFAARPEALPPLRRAWREGRVERLYLAVVEGEPEWERRRVDAPIARAAGGGWR